MRALVIAWQFLTAIPLSARHHDPSPEELAASVAWFPVVGLAIGAVLAAANLAASRVFPLHVADVLTVLLLVLLTRGLHQDALADTVDGWAGGGTAADRLRIMRDPAIGAFGATALILAILLRSAGLGAMAEQAKTAVLLSMPIVGRLAMVVGVVGVPSARGPEGLAHGFLRQVGGRHMAAAFAAPLIVLPWALGMIGAAVAVAIAVLVARAMARLAIRLCGGTTGDILGATNELAEVAFLLVVPLIPIVR